MPYTTLHIPREGEPPMPPFRPPFQTRTVEESQQEETWYEWLLEQPDRDLLFAEWSFTANVVDGEVPKKLLHWHVETMRLGAEILKEMGHEELLNKYWPDLKPSEPPSET